MSEGMKIVRLKAENVKRLSAVEITPEGSVVVIGGVNGAGKSSVLDSIEYALAGKAAQPGKPVRDGEDQARVVCDLGDLKVTRIIRPDGRTHLEVSGAGGAIYPRPQAMLDKLNGKISFDPLEFSRMKPADQRETLKDLLGLDFTELDAKRAGAFEARRNLNRDLKAAKARLDAMPEFKDIPGPEVSVAELADEARKIAEHNEACRERQRAKDASDAEIATMSGLISGRKDAIAKWEDEIKNALKVIGGLEADIRKEQDRGKILFDEIRQKPSLDDTEIQSRIANAEEHNRRAREYVARVTLADEVGELEESVVDQSSKIEAVDTDKAVMLQSAKPPIEGLTIDDTGVTYNGIPFNQASSAEQLRVSVAMGLAMNPKLRVLLVRDGSLLDEKNLETIATMAAEHDAQVWIERVGEGEECQVIIEDGAVKS